MSINGSRALIRTAINPTCELQAGMVLGGVDERDMYRLLTGHDYPKEYGERASARRRGRKFEQNLFANDGALLKGAVASLCGVDPDKIWLRNLLEEVPGKDGKLACLGRTRQIIGDAMAGRPAPQIVIHPHLLLPLHTKQRPHVTIVPDFIVWIRERAAFMPGEIKSFIVRDNAVEPGDLERTRLQAAVEILALRAEFEIHKAGKLIGNGAGFVFSTPYGLKPAPIVIEELDGPLSEITRARDALKRTSVRLEHLTVPEKARLENIAAELAINYQEKCVSTCALSDVCGSRYRGTARQLGDAAATMLGPETELSRLEQLLAGATPLTQKEQIQAAALQRVARSLRLDPTLIARSQVA